ncbi:winged helix-turn-helix domain-containing protein [Patescibacteria group bacterium]
MAEVFLLSEQAHYKILKLIKQKLTKEGVDCEILKSPKTSLERVKECFHLYPQKIPKLKAIKVSDLTLDPENYNVSNKGELIKLRKKEYELLQFFITNKNQIINRNTLLENVWGHNCNPFTNTVDVHIAALRRKLKTKDKQLIKTVHGVGYRLEL